MQSPNHDRLRWLPGGAILLLLLGLFVQQAARSGSLVSSTPAPALVPTAAPLSQPRNPKVGVHTRLTDEADPQKISQTMQMVRAMGATWAVEYFPWLYIQQTDASHYDWAHPDLVVAAANAANVLLIARIDMVPAWARPPDSSLSRLDRDHYAAYADFVATFVARYRGQVHYYIIWNEPNVIWEWGGQRVDPSAYAALLKVVYPRVKAADPTATILMAGLAPTLEPPDSPVAMRDTSYLTAVYQAGGGPYFDALAVHAYGLTTPADDPSGPDKLNFARVEQIRAVMVANGDQRKPVFVTEGGWNDSPRWVNAVSPPERIRSTIAAYERANRDWPWCLSVSLWAFRLPKPAYTYMDHYTFVAPDFVPRPIYFEVQKAEASP